MPRQPRTGLAAPFFHIVNRSVRRTPIFTRRTDYRAFLRVLREGLERHPVRLVSYCILSNHWHLIVEPAGTASLVRFMQWVTATHAIRWHHHRRTVGHGPVYQGRYHSSPLESIADLVHACRYVERNALQAGLVKRAEDWPWTSLADRQRGTSNVALRPARFLGSQAWLDFVNSPLAPRSRQTILVDEWLFAPTSGTKTPGSVENTSVPQEDPSL